MLYVNPLKTSMRNGQNWLKRLRFNRKVSTKIYVIFETITLKPCYDNMVEFIKEWLTFVANLLLMLGWL